MERKPFMPADFVAKAEAALQNRYGGYLSMGELFKVTGKAELDAWTVCVTFENADQSLHLPVEVALVISDNPRCTAEAARDTLIDFVDYYFDRYFKGARHVTLPIDWKSFPFGEHTIRARGWERNRGLRGRDPFRMAWLATLTTAAGVGQEGPPSDATIPCRTAGRAEAPVSGRRPVLSPGGLGVVVAKTRRAPVSSRRRTSVSRFAS